MDHDDAVSRQVQIGLDHVGMELDRALEGGERVLGALARSATVGDHEGTVHDSTSAQARDRSTARRHVA